jgi:hypothetical protein
MEITGEARVVGIKRKVRYRLEAATRLRTRQLLAA